MTNNTHSPGPRLRRSPLCLPTILIDGKVIDHRRRCDPTWNAYPLRLLPRAGAEVGLDDRAAF